MSQLVVPSDLTPAEVAQIVESIEEARALGTRKSYASRIRQWEQWCEERGRIPLPADPTHVAAHIAYLGDQGKSVSTIKTTLAALRALHEDKGFDDPTRVVGVRKTRQGLTRRIGAAPKKQAHALALDELKRMLDTCDTDGVRDTRDRAVLLIGFAGALRRSEIAAFNVEHIGRKRSGLTIWIPSSKGDQEGEGDWVGIARGANKATCPVTALYDWLDLTEWAAGPVFRRVSRHDSIPLTDLPLTGAAIDEIVQARAALAGLGDLAISGHSLRAGHATTAAEAGVDAARIARTTRHARLETLASYVRPAEVLRDTTSRVLGL